MSTGKSTSQPGIHSEHNPVLMHIENYMNPVQKSKEIIDWKKFTESKFQQSTRIDCTEDLEKAVANFIETVCTAVT